MQLLLERDGLRPGCTLGRLSIDGTFECFTLEDVVRADGVKIPGETAIPAGMYDVDITFSPRFKRDLPLVINVAGFVGIRIHVGNSAKDTEGCILVGRRRSGDAVQESALAFEPLFAKLSEAKGRGEAMSLEIRNMGTPVA